jgi:hypothetical protein
VADQPLAPEELDKTASKLERLQGLAQKLGLTVKQGMGFIGANAEAAKKRADELASALEKVQERAKEAAAEGNKEAQLAAESEEKRLKGLQRRHEALGRITGAIKTQATATLSNASASTIYNARLEEIRVGHRLFLADINQVGKASGQTFGKAQQSIDGYRYAVLKANRVGHAFGATGDEVKGIMQELAFTLRGQVGLKNLGPELVKTTKQLYTFARVNNVEVKDALEELNYQLYEAGKSPKAAANAMLDLTVAQNRLQQRLEKLGLATKQSASIWKEDYYAALKETRAAMPGVKTSTIALGKVISELGVQAQKAGLSYNNTVKLMKATPKVLKGLPEFFKMDIGADLINKFQTSREQFIKDLGLPKDEQQKMVAHIESTLKNVTMHGPREKAIQEMLGGTRMGVMAIMKKWRSLGDGMLQAQLQQVLGEDYNQLAGPLIEAIKSGNLEKGADKLLASTQRRAAEAKKIADERKAAQQAQRKMIEGFPQLLKTSDQLVWNMAETKATLDDLVKSNYALIASLAANTFSNLGGVLGTAAGPIMAGAVGAAVGIAIGDAFDKQQDKKEHGEGIAEAKDIERKLKRLKEQHRLELEGLTGRKRLVQKAAQAKQMRELLSTLYTERGLEDKDIKKYAPQAYKYEQQLNKELWRLTQKQKRLGLLVKGDAKSEIAKASVAGISTEGLRRHKATQGGAFSSGNFLGQMGRFLITATGDDSFGGKDTKMDTSLFTSLFLKNLSRGRGAAIADQMTQAATAGMSVPSSTPSKGKVNDAKYDPVSRKTKMNVEFEFNQEQVSNLVVPALNSITPWFKPKR